MNWAPQHPNGGRDKNCLIVDQTQQWRSENCEGKRLPYWCQYPPTRLEGTKGHSWRLSDITFSKIELWFTKKTEEGAKTCNSSSDMPGFSVTWSTTHNGGSNISKVYTVPEILESDGMIENKWKQEQFFSSVNKNLTYTILAARKVNLTTQEIWDIIRSHKRELVEGNVIGCNLGQVKQDSFNRLIVDLEGKIPKTRPKVTYIETAEDYGLAFDLFSYLLSCQKEQIEMAKFYNNLFRTANPRTILQATVNNIQLGVKEADTMAALHQIYKMLGRRMALKLPFILQGFVDSKMLNNVDPNGDIFMKKHLKIDFKPKGMLNQSKHN